MNVFVCLFLLFKSLAPNRGCHSFENGLQSSPWIGLTRAEKNCFITHVCFVLFFSCNRLFYENKLLDGVTVEDRTPVVVSEMFNISYLKRELIHPETSNFFLSLFITLLTYRFNRTLFRLCAFIMWEKERRNVDETEVTTTKRR